MSGIPYWRISAFYLAYFASLGALVPYWSLYLRDRGYSPREIGALLAALMLTKLVAPWVWGTLADRHGRRMPIVRGASLAALVIFAFVPLADGFTAMFLAMLLFSFFWNASLPQFEATTLNHLADDAHHYTRLRLWGSIGFILSVVGLGPFLERHGTGSLPWLITGLFALIWLSSLAVPEHGDGGVERGESLRRVLARQDVRAFLAACFLMQASHGVYYGFYSIWLTEHGIPVDTVGILWATGVGAEVLLYLVMHRLIRRYSLHALLIVSLLLGTLRWGLIGYGVGSFAVLLVAQLLHAATFGSFHAAAIQFVHRSFRGHLQGRGQALYSGFSFGAGGAVGSVLAGTLWTDAGGEIAYAVAALVAFIAALILARSTIAAPGAAPGADHAQAAPGH